MLTLPQPMFYERKKYKRYDNGAKNVCTQPSISFRIVVCLLSWKRQITRKKKKMRFALAICRSMPLLLFAPQSFKHHYRWGEKKKVTNKSVFDVQEKVWEKENDVLKSTNNPGVQKQQKKTSIQKKNTNSEQKHKQNAQSMFHHFGFVRFFFHSSPAYTIFT